MRADVSDEAEKGRSGEPEEDVSKRTVIENGSMKPNGIATSRGAVADSSVQLELPMSSRPDADHDRLVDRARAIVESLDKLSSEDVFKAFEELDELPSDVVRAALEGSTGPAPDPERLDDAMRRAHGFPARPLRLRTLAVTKDADIFDLGPIVEQQLRLAGKAWDGRDLEPEERLDGEVEDSFAGTLEHHVLVDAEHPAAPLFDVLRYAGDAGTIFRAGTTEIVGAIAYGVVEMKDRRARVAIQEALAHPFEPPVSPIEEPEPARVEETAEAEAAEEAAPRPAVAASKKAPKKKAAEPKKKAVEPKKAAEPKKTAAAKKAASAAKAPAKKTTTKRPPAGETSAKPAKKATAKKTGAKPSSAKPSSAKPALPKKAGTKKATTKKSSAGKKPADG